MNKFVNDFFNIVNSWPAEGQLKPKVTIVAWASMLQTIQGDFLPNWLGFDTSHDKVFCRQSGGHLLPKW